MTIGEQLLNLTIEYAASVESRIGEYSAVGEPLGREPVTIAGEYEAAVRALLE